MTPTTLALDFAARRPTPAGGDAGEALPAGRFVWVDADLSRGDPPPAVLRDLAVPAVEAPPAPAPG
jgi:hypothetical protein